MSNALAIMHASASEPIRTLIVDDDGSVRAFVERVLRDAGYTTATAASGSEALDVVAQGGAIDVLITDVKMPHMSGPDLARNVRQRDRTVKVLYLTGYSDALFHEKNTLWAQEAFLDKPCTMTGLLEAVSLLVSGRIE